jgi:hypothetical protein
VEIEMSRRKELGAQGDAVGFWGAGSWVLGWHAGKKVAGEPTFRNVISILE